MQAAPHAAHASCSAAFSVQFLNENAMLVEGISPRRFPLMVFGVKARVTTAFTCSRALGSRRL
jgi:hypothetical protein